MEIKYKLNTCTLGAVMVWIVIRVPNMYCTMHNSMNNLFSSEEGSNDEMNSEYFLAYVW